MGVGEQTLLPREQKEWLAAAPRKVTDGGCHGQCGVSKDCAWGLPRAPLLVPYIMICAARFTANKNETSITQRSFCNPSTVAVNIQHVWYFGTQLAWS